MAFLACPHCKFISIGWPDNCSAMTNLVARQIPPCPECFHERKIIDGNMPATCKHGRPVNGRCYDCKLAQEQKDKAYKETCSNYHFEVVQ